MSLSLPCECHVLGWCSLRRLPLGVTYVRIPGHIPPLTGSQPQTGTRSRQPGTERALPRVERRAAHGGAPSLRGSDCRAFCHGHGLTASPGAALERWRAARWWSGRGPEAAGTPRPSCCGDRLVLFPPVAWLPGGTAGLATTPPGRCSLAGHFPGGAGPTLTRPGSAPAAHRPRHSPQGGRTAQQQETAPGLPGCGSLRRGCPCDAELRSEPLFPGNETPQGRRAYQGPLGWRLEDGAESGGMHGRWKEGPAIFGVLGVLCPRRSLMASSRAALAEHTLTTWLFVLGAGPVAVGSAGRRLGRAEPGSEPGIWLQGPRCAHLLGRLRSLVCLLYGSQATSACRSQNKPFVCFLLSY